jgi:hypothetical protein
MRRRLEERKTDPDWLDVKGTEGGTALVDPASVRSWLPYRDIEEVFLSYFKCLGCVVEEIVYYESLK